MKKDKWVVFILMAVFMVLFSVNQSNAFERHENGWVYPMNRKPTISEWESWHSYTGHVGHDYMQGADSPVYAIAEGTIVDYNNSLGKYKNWYVQPDGSDRGGAVLVRHKTIDNVVFYAVYGHNYIVDSLRTKFDRDGFANVKAGDIIAITHVYLGKSGTPEDHIHFGIHPNDIDVSAPFRGLSEDGSDHGWVDPKDFLNDHAPYVNFSDTSQSVEANLRLVGSVAWYPPNVECLDAKYWFVVTETYCVPKDRSVCFDILGVCPAF